jgi:hypothetical protein
MKEVLFFFFCIQIIFCPKERMRKNYGIKISHQERLKHSLIYILTENLKTGEGAWPLSP